MSSGKHMQRGLAALITLFMLLALVPGAAVAAQGEETEEQAVALAAADLTGTAYEGWVLDPLTEIGNETLAVEGGWLHFASGEGNSNNPGASNNPAAIYLDGYEMPANGELSFTLRPVNAASTTRFGMYIGYASPGNALFVGYDSAGWFWQVYNNNSGDYYSGSRLAGPGAGQEVAIVLLWEGQTLISATMDGAEMFPASLPLDFSAKGGEGKTVGFKAGTYQEEYTDVYMKDIQLRDLNAATYTVGGRVTGPEGEALAGVAVSTNGASEVTNNEGEYSITGLLTGGYTLSFEKDRYEAGTLTVTVDETDVTDADIALAYAEDAFVYEGIYAGWAIDPVTEKGGEVVEVASGKLRFASAAGNGNNPSSSNFPAALYLEGYEMPEEGSVSFTVEAVKDASETRFGVYLYYQDPGNNFFVGYDAGGWFWQAYVNNDGSYYSGTRVAAPNADQTAHVELEWNGKTLIKAEVNGVVMFTTPLPYDFSSIGGSGKTIGFKGGTWGSETTDVYLYDLQFTGQPPVPAYRVYGSVVDGQGMELDGVTVTLGSQTLETDGTGTFSFNVPADIYNLSAGLAGYVSQSASITVTDTNVNAGTLVLRVIENDLITISSAVMDVEVDGGFPRVARYHMDGKTIEGQPEPIETMTINGVALTPVDVQADVSDDRVEYTLLFENAANDIHYKVFAELVVVDNTLEFNITDVDYVDDDREQNPLQTILIPNHSLLSANSQQNASFAGARQSNNTAATGDTFAAVENLNNGSTGYYYAFLYTDDLAGGVWSNSQTGSTGANYRLTNTVTTLGAVKNAALSSSFWYIDRVVTAQTMPNGAIKGDGSWVIRSTEMPSAKVAIAADINDDGVVDWQDGAIAYRDILQSFQGSEDIPELVGWRIVMNFGSMAQNPFLMTLDGVKKVALHTDGLGQSLLLKGYGNEGHDSAHPDYGDIGRRIGGAADMNTLLEAGKDYGARFGIHVNAGEMYTEAAAYSDELVRYNTNGRPWIGWDWIDVAVRMDGAWDLGTGSRLARWQELKNQVGDNMDFIYLDIWGNGTNSFEDEWATRHIVQEINDMGWMFGTEFAYYGEYEATFYHWAMDQAYGGSGAKGHNSDIMRFMMNHQRDVWVADWPAYGGAAIAPLLGGYTMTDFEGWQGRSDYDYWMRNLYTNNLSTKFFQHYEITQWQNADAAMSGTTFTPEMYIRLEDERGDVVEINRVSGDYANDLAGYRSREVTLNGKTILQGEKANGTNLSGGTESYLLPWVWDAATGGRLALDGQKLYHWNTAGGTTTWQLPDEWEGLANVKVYTLTEMGRVEEKVVPVASGSITLTATAQTPYVVYPGEANGPDFDGMDWGEGTGLTDPGFNSFSLSHWSITGDGDSAEVVLTQASNAVLELTGEVALSQSVTGLVPGEKYAAYVAVDNRSAANAWIEIVSGGEVLASNYTGLSIAKNYVKADPHSTNNPTVVGNSYFQNMFVFFTAPASGQASVVLRREAGSGSTYYDNIRVVQNDAENITYDEDGSFESFFQDFEDNAAGIYPFVVGGTEGAEDNRTHLSQLHAPYTQAGYEGKVIDDVLDGNWSLKTRVRNNNGLNYQTIPQNVRFEPGVTYEISFEYQMGSPGLYQLVIGDGEFNASTVRRFDLEGVTGATPATENNTFTTQIVGSASGQTWVGIIGTGTGPDVTTWSNAFTTKDSLVIDNFSVVASEVKKGELYDLLAMAEEYIETDYEPDEWPEFDDALTEARAVMEDMDAVQADVDMAVLRLKNAMDALVPIYTFIDGTLLGLDNAPVADAEVLLRSDSLDTLTATTDANGKFSFEDIFVRDDYTLRIQVDGYVPVYSLDVDVEPYETLELTISLEMKVPADYVADFSPEGVEDWANAAGNGAQVGLASVETGDGYALHISNNSSSRNAVLNIGGPSFKYGSVEADVTSLGSWTRFGLAMRSSDIDNIVMASVEDSNSRYFWERYKTGSSNTYQSYYSTGYTIKDKETYHFKMEIGTDDRIRYWIDGDLIFTSTSFSATTMDEFGFAGFHFRSAGEYLVQNYEVNIYDVVDGTVSVTGNVTSQYDEAAIYDAWVELRREDGDLQNRSTTALDGSYTLKNVPENETYTLRIGKDGYHPAQAEIEVGDEELVADAALVYIGALAEAYTRLGGLQEDAYTPESWVPFARVMAEAAAALSDTSTSQSVVNDTLANLLLAEDGLEFKPTAPGQPSLLDPNAKYTYTGKENGITIGVDADLADFAGASVGGAALREGTDYTLRGGSVYITVLAAYLDTLSNGDYVVVLEFMGGNLDVNFTVNIAAIVPPGPTPTPDPGPAPTPAPDPDPGAGTATDQGSTIAVAPTGDNTAMGPYIALLIIAFAALCPTALFVIKRRFTRE